MGHYGIDVIERYGQQFDLNYRRGRRWLTRRRFGDTYEGVVIERLHKMMLAQSYVLNVRVHGRNQNFRLVDFAPKRPTAAMLRKPEEHPTRTIRVTYGQYRNFDLFNRQVCEFEADVTHRIMQELPNDFHHGGLVVMAGVVMFGEIWASKGMVV